MRTKLVLVCSLASLAWGQFASMNMNWRPDGDALSVTLGGQQIYTSQPVAAAPYSAERTSERVQTINDGTRITTAPQNKQKTWRNLEGRVRSETSLYANPLQPTKQSEFILVEINDPVAGFTYVIDDSAKLVHRLTLTAPKPWKPSKLDAAAPRPQQTHENLGEQNIEGVVAEGARWTTTTPIGEVGNDRPLVSTGERWYSRELQLEVLTKNFDPRQGEFTTRITNISRAEPDASLFALPEGYKVVDEKDSFTIRLTK